MTDDVHSRRRTIRLRFRMAIGFAIAAAAVTTVVTLFTYARISVDVVEARENSARRQAYANARIARARLGGANPDRGTVVASLESRQGTPLLEFGGEWFAASVGVSRSNLPTELVELVASGRSGVQRVRLGDELFLVVGTPIAEIGSQYYEFVRIDDVDDTLQATRRTLAAGAVAATLLTGLLGALASRTVLRPLRDVAAAARTVASGDLSTKVEETGDGDLDPMLTAFNAMVSQLRARIDRDARFAGNVTHELRGPLAALSAATEHARRHADDPVAVRRALDSLAKTVGDFNSLVVDLLEMSRIEAGVAELNLEPVNVAAFVEAVAVQAEERPTVSLAPEVPGVVWFDKRRIGQCLVNLIENADRYGRGATAISVSAADGSLRFAVDDRGPGVPEHERTYIFERFARGEGARDVAGGTGLGLALVTEHARLHDGSVHVEDGPAGGARFVLRLPVRVDP